MRLFKVLIFCVIFCFSVATQGAWYANWPPPPIPPLSGGGSVDSYSPNSSLDAASLMLLSYSNLVLLLNEFEKSSQNGFNFDKANLIINSISKNLSYAKVIYVNLSIAYSQSKIDDWIMEKLRNFDYEELCQSESLHPSIMDRVKMFLREGDISGYFKGTVDDVDSILTKINSLNESVENGVVPKYDELRLLYQQFTNCMQYGYYSSIVFFKTSN